ncbi:MAG: hypothetical protein KIT40_02660 [Nitrospira sp.]|nr:hypothetical protein [Nitrospira sp.]
MSLINSFQWMVRKGLWNGIATRKYRATVPKDVTTIAPMRAQVALIPLNEAYPAIPISGIRVAEQVPKDETQTSEESMMRLLAKACTFFSPMQAGRPEIAASPHQALDEAYSHRHRQTVLQQAAAVRLDSPRILRPPTMPVELQGVPDLGMLALRGPYAGYLRKVHGSSDGFEWDLEELGSYSHHSNLYAPWAHVLFKADPAHTSLRPIRVRCELGSIHPDDANWPLATRIAMCAATTHTALVRHWTWTHLIGGEYFSAATRNHLPPDHPLCRLLWPHMVGTHASNRLATLGQLMPDGDFEAIYSLTYSGLCQLIGKAGQDFNLRACDPEEDARHRGLLDSDLPMQTFANCRRIFRVIQAHAERYLRLYYTDEELRTDQSIRNWLAELERLLPNGLSLISTTLTCATLARVVARLIYLVSVQHEQLGTQLWNYQLWAHTHPVRVYRDGRRMPEDVYQRLVNSNYILNVARAPLLQDYAPLALVESGRPDRHPRAEAAFARFRLDLARLQRKMERKPWAPWTLYPADLEANINA